MSDINEAHQDAIERILNDEGLAGDLVCEAITESEYLPEMLAHLCVNPKYDDEKIGREVRSVVRCYLVSYAESMGWTDPNAE